MTVHKCDSDWSWLRRSEFGLELVVDIQVCQDLPVHRTTLQPVAVVESPPLTLLWGDTPAHGNLSITLLQTLKPWCCNQQICIHLLSAWENTGKKQQINPNCPRVVWTMFLLKIHPGFICDHVVFWRIYISEDLHLDHTITGTNLPTQEGWCIRGSDSTLSSMGRVSMSFSRKKIPWKPKETFGPRETLHMKCFA